MRKFHELNKDNWQITQGKIFVKNIWVTLLILFKIGSSERRVPHMLLKILVTLQEFLHSIMIVKKTQAGHSYNQKRSISSWGIITNLNCGKKFKICALAEKLITVLGIAEGIIPLEFLELGRHQYQIRVLHCNIQNFEIIIRVQKFKEILLQLDHSRSQKSQVTQEAIQKLHLIILIHPPQSRVGDMQHSTFSKIEQNLSI